MDAQLCEKKKKSVSVMEHAFYLGNVSRLFAVFDSPQQQ